METAYLHDLHTEGLQPGQEPVQRGLILQRAMDDKRSASFFARLTGRAGQAVEPAEKKVKELLASLS